MIRHPALSAKMDEAAGAPFAAVVLRAAEALGGPDEAATTRSASLLHRFLCSGEAGAVASAVDALARRPQLLGALLAAALRGIRSIERAGGNRQAALLAAQAVAALLRALHAQCGQPSTGKLLAFFLPGLVSGRCRLSALSAEARTRGVMFCMRR